MKILKESNLNDFRIENGVLVQYVGHNWNVTIPNTVKRIRSNAFSTSPLVQTITIPDGVMLIEDYAFVDCSNLKSIRIGSDVVAIGHNIFHKCYSLQSIVVDAGNTSYHDSGNCLIETNAKKLISGCSKSVIPTDGSVSEISLGAFWGATDIKTIVIPDSVTTIGYSAFSHCSSLETIVIPDSVTSFESDTLFDCKSLKYVFTTNPIVIKQLLEDRIPKCKIKSSVYDLYDTEED